MSHIKPPLTQDAYPQAITKIRLALQEVADHLHAISAATINAHDYGLRESASAATNTAALNAAADALRAAVSTGSSERYTGARLYVPPGVYDIAAGAGSNVGWDLSRVAGGLVWLNCEGAVFRPDATLAGKTVIDCIGSRFLAGVLPYIWAMVKASPPAVGLQFGRHDDFMSSGDHHLKNLHIRGYFTRAAVYNGNAEECVFDHPLIFNEQQTADSYCWIQDGRNVWLPITDADITGLTQNLPKAFNLNTFINGAFRKGGYDIDTNTYGSSVGSALYMTRCLSHKFINTYFVTSDDAGIVMASDGAGFRNVRFDQCHFEGTLDHVIKMMVADGTAWLGRGIQLAIANSNAVVSIFDVDAGVSTVNIHDFDLSVRAWNAAPSSNIFNAPAKVTLTGARVALPNLTHWDDVASFKGQLITPTSWNVHHKGDGLQQQTITLADDTATAITLPANCTAHFILTISVVNSIGDAAIIWVSPGVNNSKVMAQPGTAWATLNGTALTGTTGTDGKLTIGVTAGTVYLENRIGGSRIFSLSFLANR